jgi:hypothetical protein
LFFAIVNPLVTLAIAPAALVTNAPLFLEIDMLLETNVINEVFWVLAVIATNANF